MGQLGLGLGLELRLELGLWLELELCILFWEYVDKYFILKSLFLA